MFGVREHKKVGNRCTTRFIAIPHLLMHQKKDFPSKPGHAKVVINNQSKKKMLFLNEKVLYAI